MSDSIILHIDLNSFFATVQQQVNPFLRGKPVGIIKAVGRTCIIAASVEAKKFGVKTGTDVFEAKRLCPKIILVPADFEKYEDITGRFINICKTYSPVCEVFSLDECFIDVGQSAKFFKGAEAIAYKIKSRLKNEVGEWMRCSIGISYNRLLAKLASSQIKPDGLFTITRENALKILDKSELTDVCGLGFALLRHLKKLGISSFKNLRSLPFEFLRRHFGPFWSVHLYNIARGIDNSSLTPYAEIADAKSVGRTYTTHRNLTSRKEILKLMRNLCEETATKARQMGLSGRYAGVAVRGEEKDFYGHKTLKNYIDDGRMLFDICKNISKDWNIVSVRFCGVTLGMLVKNNYLPVPLLPTERKRRKLVSAVDKINNYFGDYTVYPGQLLGMEIVRPEVNGYFGDKKYRLRHFLR